MPQATGLIAIFRTAPGRLDDLMAALALVADAAAGEGGTLVYAMHRAGDDPDVAIVYEVYRDADAQALHIASDAVAMLKQRLPELLAAPPELRPLTPLDGAKGLIL